MWNLKNKTNEQTTEQKQTYRYKEQTDGWLPEGRGEVDGGRKEIGKGDEAVQTSSCKINESQA